MHADTIGWVAAALMGATFSCREARLLRPLAVATNFAFVGYGLMAGLAPVLVLHLALLPINLWRCAQAYGVGAKALVEGVSRAGRVLCTVALASLPLLAGCLGTADPAPSGSRQPTSLSPPWDLKGRRLAMVHQLATEAVAGGSPTTLRNTLQKIEAVDGTCPAHDRAVHHVWHGSGRLGQRFAPGGHAGGEHRAASGP